MKTVLHMLPKIWQKLFLSIISLALITSCETSDTEPVNPYSYFPLEVGRYQIYNIVEEVYSAGQKGASIKSWKEKDEVIRMEKNTNGSVTYTMVRSVLNSQSQYWVKTKEYVIYSFPDKIIVNLDNEIFTPLIFPYSTDIKWDGYEYFNLDSRDPRYGYQHHYENINEPLKLDSIKLDKTLKVAERSDTANQAQYRLGFKYYASGIGLVADEQTNFDYLQENGVFIGYRTISSGSRKIKRIVEYGVSK